MYKGKRILALIPARGGSSRIPKKNIVDLGGKPLLAHTILLAQQLDELDGIVVSSNDQEILDIAQTFGAEILRRPTELAEAHVKDEPVLLHAIDTLESAGRAYDYIVMLQVTSPFRSTETTKKVIQRGVEGAFDVVATVTENREYFRTLRNGTWEPVVPNAPRRQQEREPFYAESGVCYIMSVSRLKETGQIFARQKEDFIIVSAEEALDINTPLDLEFARFLISKRRV